MFLISTIATLVLGLFLPATAAFADEPLKAKLTAVTNRFPQEVVFAAEAESSVAEVRSLTLRLAVGSEPFERYGNFEFSPGRRVLGRFSFKTGGASYVPAGTDLTYWLEVQDAAGNRLETPKEVFWYADTRFQWQEVQDGSVTVFSYGNAERSARAVLEAARQTQEKVGRMLDVQARPLRVMLYNSVQDFNGAQPPESETRRREVVLAGRAHSGADLVQVLDIQSLGFLGTAENARHEITHLFVHWAGGSHVSAWLNEGLAVWAQSYPFADYIGRLQQGIRTDDLLLLRGLDSFPGSSEENILAYGQSYSVVKFLIDTYGPDRIRQLLETIKGGDGAAEGVQKVYGLTLDQLDAEWRKSVGAKPRSYEIAIPTPQPIPIIVPFGTAPTPLPEATSAAAPTEPGLFSSPPPLLLIAGGVLSFLVLAAFGATATLLLLRRRS